MIIRVLSFIGSGTDHWTQGWARSTWRPLWLVRGSVKAAHLRSRTGIFCGRFWWTSWLFRPSWFWHLKGDHTVADCSSAWVMRPCRVASRLQPAEDLQPDRRDPRAAARLRPCVWSCWWWRCRAPSALCMNVLFFIPKLMSSSFRFLPCFPAARPDVQHQCLTQDFSLLCH